MPPRDTGNESGQAANDFSTPSSGTDPAALRPPETPSGYRPMGESFGDDFTAVTNSDTPSLEWRLSPDQQEFGQHDFDMGNTDTFLITIPPADIDRLKQKNISPDTIESEIYELISKRLDESFHGAVRFVSANAGPQQLSMRVVGQEVGILTEYCFRLNRDPSTWTAKTLRNYLNRYKHAPLDTWAPIRLVDMNLLARVFPYKEGIPKERTISPNIEGHYIQQIDRIAQKFGISRNRCMVSIIMFQIEQTYKELPKPRSTMEWSTTTDALVK